MIKELHFVKKRLADGGTRWFVYAWRGGPKVMSADGSRPALTVEALEKIASAKRRKTVAQQPSAKTIGTLVAKWQSGYEWAKLRPNTKNTWSSSLRVIEAKWGKVPLAVFDDTRMIAKVVDWREDRRETPRVADNGVTVLRALLKYGVQRGELKINVAKKIGKIYTNGQRAEIIWTPEDLKAFQKAAGDKDRATYEAVLLCSVTELRREDLARITWASIHEYAIAVKAAKSSRGKRQFAKIPRIPQLDTVLNLLERQAGRSDATTVLINSRGRPWHLDTLSREVTRIAKLADIAHIDPDEQGGALRKRFKHLHDVRGTFATYLMTESDISDAEIAGIMGWSVEEVTRIRRIYVDDTARQVAIGKRIALGLGRR